MSEQLDQQVDKMPRPKFLDGSPNSRLSFTFNEEIPIALTITWQWVLAKIGEALIARNAREVINLLFSLDYVQLNENAVSDIQSIVRQPVEENVFRELQAKISSFKYLMNEYLHSHRNNYSYLNDLINESNFLLEKLKILGILGIGAFMICSGLQLALLQEKANLDITEWSSVKNRAIEYSNYAASVTPTLFRLTVGRIDKECKCTKYEVKHEGEEPLAEYECSYFDGKDIHIFREVSPNAGTQCNKHRLQMFYDVTSNVNKTAARPVREAVKKWKQLAASI